jgi:hypothetical protein
MISRYLVIILAFGVAIYRMTQGAVVEATGLIGLGAGLLCLRLPNRTRGLRLMAWVCFAVTAWACLVVARRMMHAPA